MRANDMLDFTLFPGNSIPRPYMAGNVYAAKIDLLTRVVYGVLHLHESGTAVVWRLGDNRWPNAPYVTYEALDTYLNDFAFYNVRAVHAGEFSEQDLGTARDAALRKVMKVGWSEQSSNWEEFFARTMVEKLCNGDTESARSSVYVESPECKCLFM